MFKSKKKKIIAACLSAILLVGILVGSVAAVQEEESALEVKRDIVVETISPEIGDVIIIGEYIGIMEPSQQVPVLPKVAGEVLAVHFNVGDYVKAGDILFEIDPTVLEVSIAQTEAAVASAQAKANQGLSAASDNLSTFNSNVRDGHDSTLRAAQNAIDAASAALDGAKQARNNAQIAVEAAENRASSAQANLNTARQQLDDFVNKDILPLSMSHLQPLMPGIRDQVISQLNDAVTQAGLAVDAAWLVVDQADVALRLARQGVEQAQSGLDKAHDGYQTAEVMVAAQRRNIESQVEMARLNTNFDDQQIAIDKLHSDLDNFKGIAPISGVIERRSIEPFHMASPGAPAFVISNKHSMNVTFKIPRNSHAFMHPGDKVTMEDRGMLHTGIITEISTGVDAGGMFTVKANIPNPPASLYTGASVKIFADSQKAEDILILPISAVFYERGLPFVYIAEGGHAKKVQIDVGIFNHDHIHVISGITQSDRIISTWSARLTDGVEIVLA